MLKKLIRDRIGFLSLLFICIVVVLGTLAPIIAPHDPNEVNMALRYASPSWQFWFGNDHLGRCILSRIIFGIRPSVLWVMGALMVSVSIGTVLGFIAGYFRGRIDQIIMRICDIVLSFPGYVMTLAIIGILGVGLMNILIAFILVRWAWFARVIRTSVLQYSDMEYIRYAKTIGVKPHTIMKRHLMPVTFSDIAVIASSSMGSMILQISGLSFLGLGMQAPNAEWGMMLNEAREVMLTRPELLIAPAASIVLVVASFNFLADSLQVVLNPAISSNKKSIKQQKKQSFHSGHKGRTEMIR